MHKVCDSVRSTHGQDGAIVLDIQEGQMFNLNFVGSRILELLESGSTEQQIVDVVSREFNADIDRVTNDVAEFLEELKAHKLLKTEISDGKF
jgi:Coenzyme PQQ synthesis protein D (PqqD)